MPPIYFSFDSKWASNEWLELKPPRPEMWGGLVFALAGLMAYAGIVRRDAMCALMGFWGILGGAVGFPLAQGIQAWQAWNPDAFAGGFASQVNWWNFMETGFGCVMGAFLGLGLWLHRRRIAMPVTEPEASLPALAEVPLLLLHVALLVGAVFITPALSFYIQWGYVLGTIPIAANVGGRWWPYLQVFLVTAIPIAGKTLRNLGYEEQAIDLGAGWLLYVVVPLSLTIPMVLIFARRRAEPAQSFLAYGLLFCTWLYFGLNFAFFRFPWPWEKWTGRTPNAIVFVVFAISLTLLAISRLATSSAREGEVPAEPQ